MGNVYSDDPDKWDEAKEEYKAAADLAREEGVASGDVFAFGNQECQHNYADILYRQERYPEAALTEEDLLSWDPYYVPAYQDLAKYSQLGWGNLEYSLRLQKQLISYLKDESIMAQERNSLILSAAFYTGPDSAEVYLTELPAHQYYVYYSTALTSYLLGNAEEAEGYIETARKLQTDGQVDASLVLEAERLLESDIKILSEARPDFRPGIDEFSQRFL